MTWWFFLPLSFFTSVTIHSVNVPPPPASATDSRNMKKLHSNPTKNHSCQSSNYFLKDDHVQEIKRNETCWFVEREDTISSSSSSWSRRNPSKVEWTNSIHQDNDRTSAHRQTFSKSLSSNIRNQKDSNVSSKKRSSFETMDGGGGGRGGDAQPFYKRLKYGKRVSK